MGGVQTVRGKETRKELDFWLGKTCESAETEKEFENITKIKCRADAQRGPREDGRQKKRGDIEQGKKNRARRRYILWKGKGMLRKCKIKGSGTSIWGGRTLGDSVIDDNKKRKTFKTHRMREHDPEKSRGKGRGWSGLWGSSLGKK